MQSEPEEQILQRIKQIIFDNDIEKLKDEIRQFINCKREFTNYFWNLIHYYAIKNNNLEMAKLIFPFSLNLNKELISPETPVDVVQDILSIIELINIEFEFIKNLYKNLLLVSIQSNNINIFNLMCQKLDMDDLNLFFSK